MCLDLQVRSVQAIPEEQSQFRGKQVPDRIVELSVCVWCVCVWCDPSYVRTGITRITRFKGSLTIGHSTKERKTKNVNLL